MSILNTKIESILFISNKPLSVKRLAEICEVKEDEVDNVIGELKVRYNTDGSGIKLAKQSENVQFVTAPEVSGVVQEFLKQELTGEMTKPQLETLTIIAYRGPMPKHELEQIRGVNCSMILRNLMMRGLIESQENKILKIETYSVTLDFLNFLGITRVQELPDYEKLSQHQNIESLLEKKELSDTKKEVKEFSNQEENII